MRSNLGGKIFDFLFNTFAHLVADKPLYRRVGTVEQPGYGLLRILDERLTHQAHLAEKLVEPALDHLFDDFRRLAAGLGLGDEDRLFLVDELGRNRVLVDELRIHCGDMHCDIARQPRIGVGLD